MPCGGSIGTSWNRPEPAISGMGQDLPLLTEATLQPPQYQRPGTHTLYSTPGKSHYKKVQLIKSFAGFGRGWPAGYTCANMSDSWV